ncbi:MAG: hypothetical protein J0G29_01310 [Alphaproteobacteria bacterium]|nr:hypothetical protein [Alphaproteobacteria bacterium]
MQEYPKATAVTLTLAGATAKAVIYVKAFAAGASLGAGRGAVQGALVGGVLTAPIGGLEGIIGGGLIGSVRGAVVGGIGAASVVYAGEKALGHVHDVVKAHYHDRLIDWAESYLHDRTMAQDAIAGLYGIGAISSATILGAKPILGGLNRILPSKVIHKVEAAYPTTFTLLVKDYVRDMETRTGTHITGQQRHILKETLQAG